MANALKTPDKKEGRVQGLGAAWLNQFCYQPDLFDAHVTTCTDIWSTALNRCNTHKCPALSRRT